MDTLHSLQQLLPLALPVLRLALWLLILSVIFIPLEKLFGSQPKKIFRPDFLTDLGYYLLNSIAPKFLLALPTAWLALAANSLVPAEIRAWGGSLSVWPRFVLTMAVAEFGIYWGHRMMHEVPFLWRFHAIHHSAAQLDWLVNTRAHPVDMVLPRLCGFIPMYALGLVQPLGENLDWVLLAVLFVSVLWGFFIHANLRWRFGWLEWLITTPAFHHWHHTNDGPSYINKNYSAMLPWVDWLFGTLYLPKAFPEKYGINKPMTPGLLNQLVYPFAWRKS
jgi:sterol desaturase/sphingolipid hydroxylase (fatty acid hydroxylase superfamily)